MNRFSSKRSRLIAAQAALVLLLCVLLYVGLLRPNSLSPLNGAGVPGGPNANTRGHHGGSNGPSGPSLPGDHQTASTGNGGGHGNQGGGPAPFTPETPSGNPNPPSNNPGGDQYQSTVASLQAKLRDTSAKAP